MSYVDLVRAVYLPLTCGSGAEVQSTSSNDRSPNDIALYNVYVKTALIVNAIGTEQ